MHRILMFNNDLEQLAPGMYNGHFNLGTILEGLGITLVDKGVALDEDYYGVADNTDQIREHFKEHIADPTALYVIDATPVNRDLSEKGQRSGWRWHKWGPYIGTQTPTTEYLDDEPEIESVIVFHLYRIKDK